MRENAAQFLLAEKSGQWTFNYWSHAAPERKTMPYPDDLDDTFAALAALYGYNPKIIDGAVLAQVAKLLIATEVAPGGPYRTWLMQSDMPEWRDVDIVVNSNVGYFLHLLGISLPSLTAFIEKRIRENNVRSPYYPGIVQVIYFVSRFYRGDGPVMLREMLLSERNENGSWKNQLESAMAISALIHLGFANDISEKDIDAFAVAAEKGIFQPYPFCMDPSRAVKSFYAGSAALTAAFCAEALGKWISFQDSRPIVPGVDDSSISAGTLDMIKVMARERMQSLPRHLKDLVLKEIEKTETEEIASLPYLFQTALGEKAKQIPQFLLDELALANLYGWAAYKIYDGFLDGGGNPVALPAANFLLRELTIVYAKLDLQIPGIAKYYQEILDVIDDANVWEQINCRAEVSRGVFVVPSEFPEKSTHCARLADRSIGHALPALAIMLAAGYGSDSLEVRSLLSFFRNYLVARQLHDDAHDWSEDLSQGQITTVVTQLMRAWQADHDGAEIDLTRDMPGLRNIFWHTVILDIVMDIKNFLTRARLDLANAGCFQDMALLLGLLERLESAADRTIDERNQAIDFLRFF